MQVTTNKIPDKKNGLEMQVQGSEKTSFKNPKSSSVQPNENIDTSKGTERNETSQYLKVLSRIENLLIQEKLPDAAIEGFVGAIKKQLDAMGEDQRQMLLKLPEAESLELKNFEDLPEIIMNNIRNEEKLPTLLKFLRQPRFAAFMENESKASPKTYTVQNAQNTSSHSAKGGINILDIPKSKENSIAAEFSSPDKVTNINNQV